MCGRAVTTTQVPPGERTLRNSAGLCGAKQLSTTWREASAVGRVRHTSHTSAVVSGSFAARRIA